MKKITVIILVLVMAISLTACRKESAFEKALKDFQDYAEDYIAYTEDYYQHDLDYRLDNSAEYLVKASTYDAKTKALTEAFDALEADGKTTDEIKIAYYDALNDAYIALGEAVINGAD